MKHEHIYTIIINVISNIIFQIFLAVLSGSGLIYTLNKIFKSLNDNKVTISIIHLIYLIFFCVLITITVILLIKTIKSKNSNHTTFSSDDIKDYYFSYYEKHITIYKNGNGIIIHRFKVIAKDINKLKQIRRRLNIEDGMKTSKFSTLNKMMKTNTSERFKEFGFWYKSDNDIVSEVKEYYWDSKMPNENKKAKNNPQEIRWIFKINKDKLKKETPYEICYVISVPGLFALDDGRLRKELQNDESEEKSYSGMHIDHKIQKLKYIISFEDGVNIKKKPECKCIISEQDGSKTLDISGKEYYDLLYTKYIFNIENPVFGSDINISWQYHIVENDE